MKNLSLLVFALVICCSVSAQTSDTTTMHRKHQNEYSQSANHPRYEMQDGRLVMYSHGVKNTVIKDVTLPNGTTITTDGKVTWKDGKTQTLQDGESIGMNGKIHMRNNMKNGNHEKMNHHHMKNKADSTK